MMLRAGVPLLDGQVLHSPAPELELHECVVSRETVLARTRTHVTIRHNEAQVILITNSQAAATICPCCSITSDNSRVGCNRLAGHGLSSADPSRELRARGRSPRLRHSPGWERQLSRRADTLPVMIDPCAVSGIAPEQQSRNSRDTAGADTGSAPLSPATAPSLMR
jgi:hypothetical protein